MDSDLIAFDKIQTEGPFHAICNGGCITYVELKEAPIGNDEGLREYVECAIKSGVHYLGLIFRKTFAIIAEQAAFSIFVPYAEAIILREYAE